jgi:hypothetical protein
MAKLILGHEALGRWKFDFIGDDGGSVKGHVTISLPPAPKVMTKEQERSAVFGKIKALAIQLDDAVIEEE